jgi:hypothetical protein
MSEAVPAAACLSAHQHELEMAFSDTSVEGDQPVITSPITHVPSNNAETDAIIPQLDNPDLNNLLWAVFGSAACLLGV